VNPENILILQSLKIGTEDVDISQFIMLHRGVLEKEIIMFISQDEAEKRGSESGKKDREP